jgi:biotin carboxylase
MSDATPSLSADTPSPRAPTVLALASEIKGLAFLETAKQAGCHVILVTNDRLKEEAWCWHAIDEQFTMADIRHQPDITHGVSYLARSREIDRIVALDDYDVETAAALREHLRLAGLGDSAARLFRDKLAMRVRARQAGIKVPGFVGCFNDAAINHFLDTTPAPWLVKPRTMAGSEGIRKFYQAGEVWDALHGLGDERSNHLLEQFIPGKVFHVDALMWRGELQFALASNYGVPPMTALQGRGVFTTRVLPQDGDNATALLNLNRQLLSVMGYPRGPSHSEFILAEDGTWYFLETAARVAGGNIDKVIEAATGIVMWQEAARLEVADFQHQPYSLPTVREGFAGLIAVPSKTPFADTSPYDAPEVVTRLSNQEFVTLVVAADSFAEVERLLAHYAERLSQEVMP